MDPLTLARLQFGVTTIYHFFFVPLTIGLSVLVALMQTAWYRTGNMKYLKMTKFWGKLLLINIAMGVVTGIVLEFQFGMNWSDYSRFVGDVFGAPLAMEALLAFFLEATFLGLWIFGWDRLPKKIHLACIWALAIGTNLSAAFIVAANSWMQHPVGYRINPDTQRAEMTSLWEVLTNSTNLVALPHILTGAFVAAAALIVGVSGWHLLKRRHIAVMRSSLKLGMWVALVAGAATALTGDLQAKIMTQQQPMKMAAAEAIYNTQSSASFSIFTIGTLDGREEVFSIRIPDLLSYLAKGNFTAEVEGVNDVQRDSEARFGPGDYRPVIPVTYWGFRLMIGLGAVTSALALLGLWLTRRGRLPTWKPFWWALVLTIPLPLLGNAFGWLFTEMGRQPWVVYGLLFTRDSVSPNVPSWQVGLSLGVFTILYLVLALIEVRLLLRYANAGPEEPPKDEGEGGGDGPEAEDAERSLAFAY
jgi:cytochrome d ubiquinol oxidase subunit I